MLASASTFCLTLDRSRFENLIIFLTLLRLLAFLFMIPKTMKFENRVSVYLPCENGRDDNSRKEQSRC